MSNANQLLRKYFIGFLYFSMFVIGSINLSDQVKALFSETGLAWLALANIVLLGFRSLFDGTLFRQNDSLLKPNEDSLVNNINAQNVKVVSSDNLNSSEEPQ